jgi:hypothetical protein
MASIPEVNQDKPIEKANENKVPVKQIEKKLPVKPKKHKAEHHQPLYHGQRKRTSERIKMNSFKTPMTGIGSSQTQPIEIKDTDGDVLTQEDTVRLGTCNRKMKSWKNLSKKK